MLPFNRFFVVALLSLAVAWPLAGCAKEKPVGPVVEKAPVNSVPVEEPLTGQALFADIAKTDDSSMVRQAALEKLTDQTRLADVAKNANDQWTRMMAAERLDASHRDVATGTYVYLAKRGAVGDIRRAAIQKLAEMESTSRGSEKETKKERPVE